MRSLMRLVELAETSRFPTLTLPSWAVDDEILDRIEGLLMSIYKEGDPEGRAGTWKIIEDVQKMRSYINHGEWGLDQSGNPRLTDDGS